MNRKKFVALTILLISFALMLGGCLSNQSNIENHNEYDNGYRDGYNDGYRDGYDDGKEVGIDESYHES